MSQDCAHFVCAARTEMEFGLLRPRFHELFTMYCFKWENYSVSLRSKDNEFTASFLFSIRDIGCVPNNITAVPDWRSVLSDSWGTLGWRLQLQAFLKCSTFSALFGCKLHCLFFPFVNVRLVVLRDGQENCGQVKMRFSWGCTRTLKWHGPLWIVINCQCSGSIKNYIIVIEV